jgi:hypothetical protein
MYILLLVDTTMTCVACMLQLTHVSELCIGTTIPSSMLEDYSTLKW